MRFRHPENPGSSRELCLVWCSFVMKGTLIMSILFFEYDCLGPKRLLTTSAAEGTWSCVCLCSSIFITLRCLWSLTRLSLISIRFGAFLMLYSYFLEIQNHTESLWRALAPNLSISSDIRMSKMSQTTSDKIQASFLILSPLIGYIISTIIWSLIEILIWIL